jgi:hypothetical protein
LVADHNGDVVGVAAFERSSRAPFGVLQLDVHAASRRSRVGTELLAKMRDLHPGHKMLARVRPWHDAALAFFEARGFAEVERVLEGWIDPAEPELANWIDEALTSTPASITIEPFARADRRIEAVAFALDSWFERHHRWLPSANRTIQEAIEAFILPALPGTMNLAAIDDIVVGAGVLVRDPFQLRPGGGHLAYLGVGEPHPEEHAIVRGLIAACLGSARSQRREVQIETSDKYEPAWQVVNALPTAGLYEGLVVLVG